MPLNFKGQYLLSVTNYAIKGTIDLNNWNKSEDTNIFLDDKEVTSAGNPSINTIIQQIKIKKDVEIK